MNTESQLNTRKTIQEEKKRKDNQNNQKKINKKIGVNIYTSIKLLYGKGLTPSIKRQTGLMD